MIRYKVLVTGPFNSGKTTFIKTLCETFLGTDCKITNPIERKIKKYTTVAFDFGIYKYSEDIIVHIFGTPGNLRFRFMWDILSKGMKGYILLIDSSRKESIIEGSNILRYFRSKHPKVPFVIGANKRDIPNAMPPKKIRELMHLNNDVPIVPVCALRKREVEKIINLLVDKIINR